MRIFHVPHTYAPNVGGTEYLCSRLGETLVEMGHEVEVAVADASYYSAYTNFNVARLDNPQPFINGVRVHRIPFCDTWQYRVGGKLVKAVVLTKWKRLYWFMTYRLTEQLGKTVAASFLAKRIEAFQPDVVMTMAHLLAPTQWVLKLRQTHSFPLVHIPLVHYNQYDEIAQNRDMYQKANSTITLTQTEATALIEKCDLHGSTVFVGSIGTEIPSTLPPQTGEPYVLCFSRKEPYKGIEETIAAMRKVWRTVPHLPLILAGPRTANSGFLDILLAQLSPDERTNVKEVGHVTADEKSALLRNALCLVFPSKSESFGLVLIEAMAHGTPPITWDIPLFRETVQKSQTGLLAEPNNGHDLAEKIAMLAHSPTLTSKLGENGREVVQVRYQWHNVVQNYIRAYKYAQQAENNNLTY